ncbi:MAG: RraA family protein [Shinella sp.]|uniref:RraA family protein n=1 Tax=Shinella sp. TaxID=1870904 RepID=UPI00403637E4
MHGFQILPRPRTVSAEIAASFHGLPVANISDCMSRMAAGGAELRPLHKASYMSGPALTVRTRPGDNLMVHKALELALPGDVVIVDAGGDLTNAIIGELMIAFAKKRGIAGIVIDGAVRDLDAIASDNFPVYARGVTHRGPYKDGPGAINVPVSIGGMPVQPGDLIVGDQDGLLAVPAAEAPTILAATRKKHAAEEIQMAAILAGKSDREWINKRLAELGCEGLSA